MWEPEEEKKNKNKTKQNKTKKEEKTHTHTHTHTTTGFDSRGRNPFSRVKSGSSVTREQRGHLWMNSKGLVREIDPRVKRDSLASVFADDSACHCP